MSKTQENPEVHRITESVADSLLLFARQWNESAAEDIVQNAMLKLLRTPVLDNDNIVAWMFTVVRNEANDRFRSRKKRQLLNENYARSRRNWFESDHESRLDAETVAGNLKKLPLDMREIIVAKIWGDLTYEEIAAMVGSSKSTVHRKYVEGLSELRKMVDR